jgi:hypothetical protein
VFLNQGCNGPNLTIVQAIILRQRYLWLKPEFGFSIRALHVYMAPRFFAREEIKPILAVAEDGWAHALSLRDRQSSRDLTTPASNSQASLAKRASCAWQ